MKRVSATLGLNRQEDSTAAPDPSGHWSFGGLGRRFAREKGSHF